MCREKNSTFFSVSLFLSLRSFSNPLTERKCLSCKISNDLDFVLVFFKDFVQRMCFEIKFQPKNIRRMMFPQYFQQRIKTGCPIPKTSGVLWYPSLYCGPSQSDTLEGQSKNQQTFKRAQASVVTISMLFSGPHGNPCAYSNWSPEPKPVHLTLAGHYPFNSRIVSGIVTPRTGIHIVRVSHR